MAFIQPQITELLNKKMDRQEFLKHVAVGLVALTGLGSAFRILAPAKSQSRSSSVSYGSSSYGGGTDVSTR